MATDTILLNSVTGNQYTKNEKCKINKPLLIAISILTGIAVIAGSLTATYFLNHNFSVMLNCNMNISKGLLYIGVPTLGASFLIGIAVHIYRKHQQRKECDFFDASKDTHILDPIGTTERFIGSKEFINTLQSLKPNRKQMIITGIALLALAIIGTAGYFILQYVPGAHQWMHNQVIPALQSKIQIWQALSYIGGGTAAVVLATGLTIYLLQKRAEDKEIADFDVDIIYENISEQIDDPNYIPEIF